ncbi:InlB B-repeat-containing protein [Collinsella bouchesdurhonensis]|uniref:InlB B-repeat-containing protein n=2 Tax=Collinsella bouchesdurhonensis TaxID=1907654 RepID=UPI003F8BDE0D
MGTLKNKQLDLGKSQAVVKGLSSNYGMNDVTAISLDDEFGNGKKEVLFCPWLPTGTTLVRVDASVQSQSVPYTDSAVSGKTGTLYPACKLTLSPYGTGTDGHALALFGQGVEAIQPAIVTGQVVERYTASPNPYSEQVMDASGKLSPNVTVNDARLTDAQGNWIYSGDTDGATVTLYAQWTRKPYTIHFEGGEGATGHMDDALFDIDVAGQLPANRFNKPGYTFAGWAPSASVGGAISDGAWVTNLCAKNVDGNILLDANGSPMGLTLTARWIDNSVSAHDVAVTVGIDNSAAKGFASRLTLVDGETSFAPFEEKTDASGATYYALKREGALPAGTYMLMLDGKDTGKTVEVGDDADVASLNLYSLATSCDSKLAGVDVQPSWPIAAGTDTVYLEESYVTLAARGTARGYAFDQWTSPDGTAHFAESSSETSNPTTVFVDRALSMYATSRPIDYCIRFDPNADDATGTMEEQTLAYDTEADLFTCDFARTGYVFAGWNTKPDGSGDTFADGATVKNLMDSEGTLTLFAQWKPIAYFVHFDGNLADGPAMQSVEATYGQAFYLPENTFVFHNDGLADSTFIGWNTQRDGSGDTYEDAQQVINLCSEQGASITLYAQWRDPEPTPTPAPEPKPSPGTDQKVPQQSDTKKSKTRRGDNLPGTGDGLPLWIAIGVLGVAAIALGVFCMRRCAR